MNRCHGVALACAYFVGRAFVLGMLLAGGVSGLGHWGTFLIINEARDQFIRVVCLLWLCFTLPCVPVGALVFLSPDRLKSLWNVLSRN